jgi:hypothetical protein
MEEKLKEEISRLELELCKKEALIAGNEGFVKGHANGFNVAKHQVIDMLRELPEVEADADSIQNFLSTLTSIITRVQEIKPMFEPKKEN